MYVFHFYKICLFCTQYKKLHVKKSKEGNLLEEMPFFYIEFLQKQNARNPTVKQKPCDQCILNSAFPRVYKVIAGLIQDTCAVCKSQHGHQIQSDTDYPYPLLSDYFMRFIDSFIYRFIYIFTDYPLPSDVKMPWRGNYEV